MRNFQILIIWIFLKKIDNCVIFKEVMNCTNSGLTDCPGFNNSITTLILDFNALTNLSTPNCNKWNHIRNLSIRSNHLNSALNLDVFKSLFQLYLSHNSITEITISAPQIITVDISYNSINSVIITLINLNFLKSFDMNHNNIDQKNLNALVKSLLHSNSISYFDLGYNHLDQITIEFMSFLPKKVNFLGLAGNNFMEFNFINFKRNLPGSTFELDHLDLSNNKIKNIINQVKHNIFRLNFSGNQISKIDANFLDNFIGLKEIDLSRNPLNCLCNESESFINWMNKHKDIVVSKNQTLCKFPSLQPVFNLSCDVLSTTSTLITSTSPTSTTKTMYTTKITSTTKTMSTTKIISTIVVPGTGRPNMQAVIGVSVAIPIILIIG